MCVTRFFEQKMAGRGRAATLPAWMTASNTNGSLGNNESNAISSEAKVITPAVTTAQTIPSFTPPPSFPTIPAAVQPIFNPSNSSGFAPQISPASMHNGMFSSTLPGPPMFGGSTQQYFSTQLTTPSMSILPPMAPMMPMVPPRIPPAAPTAVMDPNNDVSAWSMYESEDGRKYWHNRINNSSTYDKPFCLKTPEERSIPPCPWKEYKSPEGKLYYSNGTESV